MLPNEPVSSKKASHIVDEKLLNSLHNLTEIRKRLECLECESHYVIRERHDLMRPGLIVRNTDSVPISRMINIGPILLG